jgi:hypothetical protein
MLPITYAKTALGKADEMLILTRAKGTRRLLAVVVSIGLPVASLAGDDKPVAYKVIYDGGSNQTLKPGTDLKMYIEPSQVRFVKDKKDVITIPAAAITEISYGQDVHRRVGTAVAVGVFTLGVGALVALSKSKKHFVGLTWAEAPAPDAATPKPEAVTPSADLANADAKPAVANVVMKVDATKRGGLAMQCDKNEYRGILAGLEGITGKKAVDSTTMTVKN